MGREASEETPELIDRAALLEEMRSCVDRMNRIIDVLEADLEVTSGA